VKIARVLPVLMYHHVSPVPGLVTVSPQNFRSQMRALAEAGWNTVTADEIAGFLTGQLLPAKSVAITFDDGYLDNYLHAFPALREFGLRATIFAVTGWLGDGQPRKAGENQGAANHSACKAAIAAGRADEVVLRWSEVEDMLAAGAVGLHSHTHTHRRWDRELPGAAAKRAALAEDLAQSRACLKSRLGFDERHLCWPQGYYDDDYVEVARASGFDHLYTTQRHLNSPRTPTVEIGRIDTRDKSGDWLVKRLDLYTMPLLGSLYCRMRGG